MSSDRERRREKRRAELEKKRAKLKAVQEKNQKLAAESTVSSSIDLTSIDNVQDLLKSLEETSLDSPTPQPKIETEATMTKTKKADDTTKTDDNVKSDEKKSVQAQATPVKEVSLSVQMNIIVHDIAPREIQVYNRNLQTEETWTGRVKEETTKDSAKDQQTQKKIVSKKLEEAMRQEQEERDEEEEKDEVPVIEKVPMLNKEEQAVLLQSSAFLEFFDKASTAVERRINVGSKYNVLVDYGANDQAELGADDLGEEMLLQFKFFDSRWAKHRAVTDITWSAKHPELFAVSYSASDVGTNDADGVVCVWSVHNTLDRPEFVFNCQSPVMSTFFPKFHPTLLVGGTYSGQIVLWDTRAKSSQPIQRTPLSSIGHTHPVYSLAAVGTQNANNLITTSTDGRLCVWSYESLQQPLEVLELRDSNSKSIAGSGNVSPTCLAFPDNEVNEFFVGSEEGAVYQCYRLGGKSGVHQQFKKHMGPVTGIDFHPAKGAFDFSDLFLTSGMDYSYNLWSKKSHEKPLYTFEDVDYAYDVKWSPSHPSIFATANGTGHLNLWDLNRDTEVPFLRTAVAERSLSTLCWSPDGSKIVTGDSTGTAYLYSLGEFSQPQPDSYTDLQSVLSLGLN
eukprot:TRINITY_DN7458_c0_g1_i1.p1 TRINITY_DN7458_c0_g1~~TRINITY_DN7458_c0_g1_i1.p1  ORF type:complete len:620 (+),score=107.90 TRINITY_DN7458_c0_g1_i1:87-1946(+)